MAYLQCFLQNLRPANSLIFQIKFYSLKKPVLVILIIILNNVSDRFFLLATHTSSAKQGRNSINCDPSGVGGRGERFTDE